jgi:hypothetical protein
MSAQLANMCPVIIPRAVVFAQPLSPVAQDLC